jgi:hypothetical protein
VPPHGLAVRLVRLAAYEQIGKSLRAITGQYVDEWRTTQERV